MTIIKHKVIGAFGAAVTKGSYWTKDDKVAFYTTENIKPTEEEILRLAEPEIVQSARDGVYWALRIIYNWRIKNALFEKSTVCYFCRCQLNYKSATIDHIIPRAVGGSDYDNNLRLACKFCNNAKGGDTDEAFEGSPLWLWRTGKGPKPPQKQKHNAPRYLNFQELYFLRSPMC